MKKRKPKAKTKLKTPRLQRLDEQTIDKMKKAVPNIKELLLSGPKFDLIVPKRTRWKRRPPIIFD
jgi:hypothetical protein